MGLETPHTQGSREQPAAEELAQKPQGPTDAGTTASPGAPGVFPGWVGGGVPPRPKRLGSNPPGTPAQACDREKRRGWEGQEPGVGGAALLGMHV